MKTMVKAGPKVPTARVPKPMARHPQKPSATPKLDSNDVLMHSLMAGLDGGPIPKA